MLAYFSNFLSGFWALNGNDIINTNNSTGGVLAAALAQAPNTADALVIVQQDTTNSNAFAGASVDNGNEQAVFTAFQNAVQDVFTAQQYKKASTDVLHEINVYKFGIQSTVGTNAGGPNVYTNLNPVNGSFEVGKDATNIFFRVTNQDHIQVNATGGALGTYNSKKIAIYDTLDNLIGYIPLYT